jgi:uncharacterized protein
VPTLTRINVTPVKGTALHHPNRVALTSEGIPFDRAFFLVDEPGGLFSCSAFGPLLQLVADHDAETQTLSLTFPDGLVVEGATTDLAEPETIVFYGRSVRAREVRGPFSEALSAFVGSAVRMLRCDRGETGIDVFPLTLVSGASVADLAERGRHDGALDSRRFRINLELDGCDPYEEDGWDGRTIELGGARLLVRGAIPRCLVTTFDPDTGRKDWDTLTQIAKYRPRISGGGGLPFGMYATVTDPGTVELGDPVRVL